MVTVPAMACCALVITEPAVRFGLPYRPVFQEFRAGIAFVVAYYGVADSAGHAGD